MLIGHSWRNRMFSHLCQLSTSPRCFIIVLIYGIRNRCQVRWENKRRSWGHSKRYQRRGGVKDALVKFCGKRGLGGNYKRRLETVKSNGSQHRESFSFSLLKARGKGNKLYTRKTQTAQPYFLQATLEMIEKKYSQPWPPRTWTDATWTSAKANTRLRVRKTVETLSPPLGCCVQYRLKLG